MSSIKPSRRALLIACPFGKLEGPGNDVDSVASLLSRHYFQITRLCDTAATRDAILDAWDYLICQTKSDDLVVIYYSGYGGLVRPSPSSAKRNSELSTKSRLYQFIVPMDYGSKDSTDFRGILDIEISALVQSTTKKTRNVTVIFDCCHSGRMTRDPRHQSAIPKCLPLIVHSNLTNHIARVQQRRELDSLGYINLNNCQDAVRILAAAELETAWEYIDDQRNRVGTLTQALIPVVEEALSTFSIDTVLSNAITDEALPAALSWKNVMLRVRQLINTEFPEQHPQAEGPHERIIFSQRKKPSSSVFYVTEAEGEVTLMAGRLAGVRKDNEYVLMPREFTEIVEDQQLAVTKPKAVSRFRTVLRVPSGFRLPVKGALAYPKTEAVYKWPIAFPEELMSFGHRVYGSKYVRHLEEGDLGKVVARITKEGSNICLYDGSESPVKCASFDIDSEDHIQHAVDAALKKAENLARATHMRVLKAEGDERLEHNLSITCSLDTRKNEARHQEIPTNGQGEIRVGDSIQMTFHYGGKETIFISVFNVNAEGKIFYLFSTDIRPPPRQEHTLGSGQYSEMGRIFDISWPIGVPVTDKIPESALFVISNQRVDLHDFAQNRSGTCRGDASQLEQLLYHFLYAQNRDCASNRMVRRIKWDMYCVNFFLCW